MPIEAVAVYFLFDNTMAQQFSLAQQSLLAIPVKLDDYNNFNALMYNVFSLFCIIIKNSNIIVPVPVTVPVPVPVPVIIIHR